MVSTVKTRSLSRERIPLKAIIKQNKNLTRERVKMLYGDIGVDIFEGKDKITILSDKDNKKSKTLINRIIKWWSGNEKLDYEENDSIKDLVHKYAYNQKRGTFSDIEEKFGQEGRKAADIFRIIGFLRTGI